MSLTPVIEESSTRQIACKAHPFNRVVNVCTNYQCSQSKDYCYLLCAECVLAHEEHQYQLLPIKQFVAQTHQRYLQNLGFQNNKSSNGVQISTPRKNNNNNTLLTDSNGVVTFQGLRLYQQDQIEQLDEMIRSEIKDLRAWLEDTLLRVQEDVQQKMHKYLGVDEALARKRKNFEILTNSNERDLAKMSQIEVELVLRCLWTQHAELEREGEEAHAIPHDLNQKLQTALRDLSVNTIKQLRECVTQEQKRVFETMKYCIENYTPSQSVQQIAEKIITKQQILDKKRKHLEQQSQKLQAIKQKYTERQSAIEILTAQIKSFQSQQDELLAPGSLAAMERAHAAQIQKKNEQLQREILLLNLEKKRIETELRQVNSAYLATRASQRIEENANSRPLSSYRNTVSFGTAQSFWTPAKSSRLSRVDKQEAAGSSTSRTSPKANGALASDSESNIQEKLMVKNNQNRLLIRPQSAQKSSTRTAIAHSFNTATQAQSQQQQSSKKNAVNASVNLTSSNKQHFLTSIGIEQKISPEIRQSYAHYARNANDFLNARLSDVQSAADTQHRLKVRALELDSEILLLEQRKINNLNELDLFQKQMLAQSSHLNGNNNMLLRGVPVSSDTTAMQELLPQKFSTEQQPVSRSAYIKDLKAQIKQEQEYLKIYESQLREQELLFDNAQRELQLAERELQRSATAQSKKKNKQQSVMKIM